MFIQIEPASEIPIYLQLSNELVKMMARGKIKSGDPLPSVRSLAADLGINMHTVNKAYHELERKELIQIIPKSGAFVSPVQSELNMHHRERILAELKPIIAEALVLGMDSEEIAALTSLIIEDLKGVS